jgi:hypothetical protein
MSAPVTTEPWRRDGNDAAAGNRFDLALLAHGLAAVMGSNQ